MSVRYDVDERVATITLDRPEQRNAVDPGLTKALGEAVAAFEADPGVWVAILTGAGPNFCAGADLKALAIFLFVISLGIPVYEGITGNSVPSSWNVPVVLAALYAIVRLVGPIASPPNAARLMTVRFSRSWTSPLVWWSSRWSRAGASAL